MIRVDKCPDCGSTRIEQESVDIGVGTEYWPAFCSDCGWDQKKDADKFMVTKGLLNSIFIRTCQSCGYEQEAKDPATYVDKKKEAWRDLKCRRCHSIDFDYGSYVVPEEVE